MSEKNAPYISLGSHLKYVREQARQTLSEVSGAVEIDEKTLERIESGLERPEEDVLLLLISHFRVKDREAVQLWELADYDTDMPEDFYFSVDGLPRSGGQPQQAIMLLAMDVRTMYSDGVEVMVNPGGVTLNFTQAVNPKQAMPIARVGMSQEQAHAVLKTLEKALMQARYTGARKQLPPSSKA